MMSYTLLRVLTAIHSSSEHDFKSIASSGVEIASSPSGFAITLAASSTSDIVSDFIVLSAEVGEVMIRGGRFFPEYRRAIMAGSIFGRSGVKLRSICVGLHMEFHVEGKSFVTSRIDAVSRHRLPVAEGRA